MTENPFRDFQGGNPYQSSSSHATASSQANPLLIPGIILLGLCGFFLFSLLLSLPGQYIRMSQIDRSTPEGFAEFLGGLVALIVWTLFTLVIVAGSIAMIRLKNYKAAVTAAILSVIPLCSPCFVAGIPFGIWALVLLFRPDVKTRFR
jgi:hypothetical protein